MDKKDIPVEERDEQQEKSSQTEEQEAQQNTETEYNNADPAAEWEQKYNDTYDKYVRLFAEFENFRRRAQQERVSYIQMANADLVKSLLPVHDDFERALEAMKNSSDKDAVKGVELIYNKFRKTLEQAGLKEMESKGKEFDPEFHEALTKIPAPSKDLKGKVVEVIEKGYFLNDKIIRYAKVVVGE